MREEKWKFEYAVPTAQGDKSIKCIICTSKEKIAKNKELCKKYGYDVISVKKLYPFSTMKHQHDFDHVAN